MQTDRGLVRDHNEDFITRWEPNSRDDERTHGWIYIVADGVGGADAGEVASEYASERTVEHFLTSQDTADWGQRLVSAMQAANKDLRQLVAERNQNKRMATTMVAVVIQDAHAFIANVGDSRAYHWRNGNIRQVTKDQSLVAKLVEEGAITEEEAVHHPHRNVILYSIGSENNPRIDLFELEVETGDMLILCSDGLTRHVEDREISAVVAQEELDVVANRLVEMANERGGQDNITVALIAYGMPAPPVIETAVDQPAQLAVPVAVTTDAKQDSSAPNHTFLLPYTILLALVEAALIIIIWFMLRQ